jgi:soluble lytic murein transglycosylase-like protein
MNPRSTKPIPRTLLFIVALCLSLPGTSLACGYIPVNLNNWTAYYARGFGLEPELLTALIWTESRYCVDAISPAGAIGLGQLMPGTARLLGVDPNDPVQNIYGAAKYLRTQWDTFQSWPLALAAYNAGPDNVRRYRGVPPFAETQKYVRLVLNAYYSLKRN